jgi:TP901 family phage tail tape measure protein
MAAPSIDTSPSQSAIKDALNKGTLNIGDDIRGTLGNVAELDKSLTKLSGTWASNISQTAKLGASLGALGSIAINATFAVANISSAFNKIQGAKSIVDGAYTSVKNLVGISKSLDFSEAILGTKEFGANIKILEETTDGVFNRISTASQIIFDNSSYQKWSIGAVAAYSKVESAAFRLATITTSSEESALSAVGARIKALRELQRETNFATNSTQTLNAQYDIASAGFSSRQAQKSVGNASINLAEVGFANIEGTNQGIVKILAANKNLGDTFRDADKRAAQLFATTKVGILTLDQLNAEAAELASTGVGAGVAFEEMATALALVTTQGLSAGEGSTAIKSLVNEIVSNVPKAQSALATLKDEAGKPIQFGFGALKAEGLIKIIERIGKATGGSRDALNGIFSSSEAAKAANALLQSGGENRKKFRDEIDNAGSAEGIDKFSESSKERGKTLEGAFRSSFNKSQAAVEEFGSGVGEGVKKNLEDTNTLLGVLGTKSTSTFGSFAGSIDGIANKFQAVSGFIGSVFSVVAPLAFFSFLFKNLGRLGEKIKSALKLDDGDVKYETLAQKIEASIVKIAKTVVSKVKDIVKQVNEEIAQVGQEVKEKTGLGQRKSNKVQPEVIKNNVSIPAASDAELKRLNSFPEKSGIAGIGRAFGGAKESVGKLTGSLGKLWEAAAPVRNVIGGAVGELFSFAKGLGVVGLAGFAASTALQFIGNVFTGLTNKASIPEIKTLTEDLKDLKNVGGLDEFVKGLSDVDAQIKKLDQSTQNFLDGLDNLKQFYNTVSGKSFISGINQEEFGKARALLSSQIAKNQQAIKNKDFNPLNDEERNVGRKIQLGIVLSEEDLQVIKKKAENQVDQIEKEISTIDAAIKDAQDNGGAGARDLVRDLQEQKKLLEGQAKSKKEAVETDRKRAVLDNQLRRLNTFKSDIPLSVTLTSAARSSANAQFADLKKTLDTVFTVDTIDISKVDVNILSQLNSQIKDSLQSIEVQADLDPQGALDALQRITKEAKATQVIASNPLLQKATDNAFKVVAEKAIGYNTAIANSYTKLFSTLSGLGAVGGEAIGQATARNLQSIQKNIATLKAGLDKPNIDAVEYANTLSKIADLSAEAFNIKNSGQITEELGKRKQVLTFNQQLLDVQKNIVSLFSQESKFGSFSVSLAQAKLAAAEKELSVKQESLAISAREEEITKRNIVEAAKAEVGNRTQLLQSVLTNGKISGKDAQSKFGIDSAIDLASSKDVANKKAEADKTIRLNQEKLKESESKTQEGFFKIDPASLEQLKLSLFKEEFDRFTKESTSIIPIDTLPELTKNVANDSVAAKLSKLIGKDANGTQFIDTEAARNSGSEAIRKAYFDAAAQIKAEQQALQTNIANANTTKNNITGGADQLKERVANIDIESAKKVVKQAEEDLKFTVVANRLKQEIGALSETIARNEAAIDASFAGQQRLVDISKGVGDAFSSLGSTASSLFSASSLGAVFSNIGSKFGDKLNQILIDANKDISKSAAKVNTLRATRDRVAAAELDALKQGRSDPDLNKAEKDLSKQLKSAQIEYDRDVQYVKQRTILEGLNATMERFNAITKEGADKLEKVATLANARLDLQGRREASTVQSNQATRGFSSSVLGLFGQNNPAAAALIGRNEILATIEKTQADKNEAGRAGEKELNTLQVQEQQLKTEETMLVNALTQTKLLSVLVSKLDPSSGIQVGDISGVNKFIGDIPKNIADAQKQTLGSLALNRETQSFVKQDTFSKINNIGLNGQSQILDIAQRNPSAGLISIKEVGTALSTGFATQQPIQNITNRTPFGADFEATQRQLQTIGGSTRDSVQQQAQQLQDQINKETRKITNDFRDASPNKPQTASSVGNTTDLRVVVNNSITIDGVKTTFGGDSLNKVGAAVGKSGDVIEKALTGFGKAFLDLSKTAFGV